MKIIKIWDKTSTGKKSQCAAIYDTDGIFPTINAGTHGYSMGQIYEDGQRRELLHRQQLPQRYEHYSQVQATACDGNRGGELSMNIKQLNQPKHSNDRVYGTDGIAPTLNTMGGGNRQPFILDEDELKTTVAYSKSTRENHIDIRGRVGSDANTLNTGDGCSNQSTQNFVAESIIKGKSNEAMQTLSKNTDSKEMEIRGTGEQSSLQQTDVLRQRMHEEGLHRQRAGRDTKMDGSSSQSQSEISEDRDMLGMSESEEDRNTSQGQQRNQQQHGKSSGSLQELSQQSSQDSEDMHVLPEQTQGTRSLRQTPSAEEEEQTAIRIRKLTPVETERLQGYPDGHTAFGKKEDGTIYSMSNTQRYKQVGNGVSSPVAATILTTMIPEGEVRVQSLFSGILGTELDLPERFKLSGVCEFDKYASDVIRYHHPDVPNYKDVTKFVERTDVLPFDLLTFGFPCQAFSIAGQRQGFEDEKGRGNLIYNVFDIIQKHKPKYFLAENVKGLLNHDGGKTIIQILTGLSQLGYELDFELVNSKHFNLAQNRERVFIFGKLK